MLPLLLTGVQVMLFQMGLVQGFQCNEEYHVIKVASRFNKNCTFNKPITECKTLQDVVTNIKSLNETCIEIYNNQNLTESIRFKYVSGLTLLKAPNVSEVVVDCNANTSCGQNGTGISFRNSSNIKIYGLKFQKCGIKRKTDLCAERQNLVFYISSAFHFDYITNVTFESVQLVESHGYSVHMFNSESQLIFRKVTIKDGTLVSNYYSDSCVEVIGFGSGGGMRIEFGGSSTFSRENQIEISSSNYQNNIAEMNDRNFSCNFTKVFFPYGRGGALSIIFNGDSRNNSVVVTNSNFTNNSALWGGSIHFKFDDHSQYNDVQVRNVLMNSSNATLYGGGILAWGVNNEDFNNFSVSKTKFNGNNASLGGGLAIMGLKGKGKYTTVMNCSFEDNAASFGAGIFIKDTKATLDTVSVSQNNIKSMGVYSQPFNGAIASFNSTVIVDGNSFIEKNINTGFLLDQTKLHIKGHLSLSENNGFDGGGMAVYGNSHIKTYKNSTLYFAYNKASSRGGGLFVMVPGPYIKPLDSIVLSRYNCFIENDNDGNISFVNNTASNKYGNAMFVSTLQHCTRGINEFQTVFTNWTNFFFRPDNDSHNVVTEPNTMTLNMDEWTPAPGIPFEPSVILYDERGTNVAETVDVTLEPESITTSTLNKKFVIDDDNKINIAFKGNKSINFSAIIVATNSEVLPHNITNITFQECPFGFYYNEQDKSCQCGRPHDFPKGIAQCGHSDIYVFKNRWVYKNASYECPSGYCIDCQNDTLTGFECKLNILKQCNETRNQTSRLCSRCIEGFSVTIGSNMCSLCTDNKGLPLIIFVYVIICIIATILFLVCNFNGYACYLNSAVFFYKCAGTVMEPVKVYYIDPVMKFLLSLLSETFESREVGICFMDGLNNLEKLAITFAKPFLIISPIVIIIAILYCCTSRGCTIPKCTNRGWKCFKMEICKRSINNILIVFWMGIIIAILQTLHSVSIDGTKYVFVYADEVYLGKNHSRYFAMAIIMIIAAVGFLLCTIFYEKFYTHLICRFRIVVYILSFLIYAIICIYVPSDVRVTLASIFCLIMVSVILLLPSNRNYQERDSTTINNNEEDDDREQLIQSNENNRNEKLLNGLELTHLSMLTLLVLLYGSMEGLYCPSISEKKIVHPCRVISISINILLYLPLVTSVFYCVYDLYLNYLKDKILATCRRNLEDATGILVIQFRRTFLLPPGIIKVLKLDLQACVGPCQIFLQKYLAEKSR